jgi:hypothetical protein
MDEIKIKHKDVTSNENDRMAMALFKAVDDEPIIEDMFPNYTSTDSINDIFIQIEPYQFNKIKYNELTKDQEYLKSLHAIIYDIENSFMNDEYGCYWDQNYILWMIYVGGIEECIANKESYDIGFRFNAGETEDVVIVNGKDINKVKQLILVYKTEEWANHKRLGLRRLSKFEEVDENHFKNPLGNVDFMKATNDVRKTFEELNPEITTIIIEPDLIDDPAFAELNHQYKEFLIRQIFKPAT